MYNINISTPSRRSLATLMLSALILSGCGSDKKDDTKEVAGVWSKAGYGEVWQISPGKIVSYHQNKFGCVKNMEYSTESSSKFIAAFQLDATGDQLTMPGDFGYVGTWSRIKQLSEACQKPLNGEQSPSINFEFFWQDVQQYYAFLSERKLDWQQIYQHYQPLFAVATPEQERRYYHEIVRMFQDAHVELTDYKTFAFSGVANKGLFADVAAQTDDADEADLLLEQYQQYLQQQAEGLLLEPGLQHPQQVSKIGYGVLPGNIGYVRFNQVSELSDVEITNVADYFLNLPQELTLADSVMQEIKQKLANTNGLIIDLRFNIGGDEAIAFRMVSHLNDQIRTIGSSGLRSGAQHQVTLPAATSPYLKPLMVLAGGMTTSAGETMTLALQSLPQATVIGEPTHGSLSNGLERSMPNGWHLRLSNELYFDTQKNLLEVQGVLPDIKAAAYFNLDQSLGSVTALDVAMQQLKVAPLNSPDQTSVQQAIRQFRQQFNQPGIAAAVIRNGKVVGTFADGMADIDKKIAMTADTPTLTASISKTTLGTAMGLLDINPALPLPALPFAIDWPIPRQTPLSWRELAQHQSGILDDEQTLICSIYLQQDGRSLFNVLVPDLAPCPTPQKNHQLFLQDYLQQQGPFYRTENFASPGVTRYSNAAAELASLALEQYTGENFSNWSTREIFTPLQLRNTFWPVDASTFRSSATEVAPAQQYIPNGDELVQLPRYSSSDFYAGALYSSANDLARYLAAIASQTPQYPLPGLDAAKREKMLGLNVPRQPGAEFPGMFWHTSGDYVGHNGLFVGATSQMYYNTATETGIVLLLNSDGQHWLAPNAEKTAEFYAGFNQLAGMLYRHALSL
jgi:CubicO group peptidase (beta-lactamase class C family)